VIKNNNSGKEKQTDQRLQLTKKADIGYYWEAQQSKAGELDA
jgi:hypothetical protein